MAAAEVANPEDLLDDELLHQLLARRGGRGLTEYQRGAFESMSEWVGNGRRLSDAQRTWAENVYRETMPPDAVVKPLVRGREVETPAVLRNLPMRPPGRR